MTHGRLTPLGKQLRYVLAGLRPRHHRTISSSASTPAASGANRAQPRREQRKNGARSPPGARALHSIRLWDNHPKGAATESHVDRDDEEALQTADEGPVKENMEDERDGPQEFPIALIADALRKAGKTDAVPTRHPHLAYMWSDPENPTDTLGLGDTQHVLSIVARHIEYHTSAEQSFGSGPFRLSIAEASILDPQELGLEDISALAAIVMEEDSAKAARLVKEMTAKPRPPDALSSVILCLLLRPYISAVALRTLLRQVAVLTKPADEDAFSFDRENRLHAFLVLFIKHGSKVWPLAYPKICDLWLDRMREIELLQPQPPTDLINRLTVSTNAALQALSLPTESQPFKNGDIRKAAMVKILTFMAEHQPPLETTKRGYRAVISLQLGERKTTSDQQWAELKTLSWPPWKEDRTAMDADITAEFHGTSDAARTVQSQQTAGYTPDLWDQVASVYAGWDPEGTPTIQTSHILDSTLRFTSTERLWAARIDTTRTLQEAWSIYLNYKELAKQGLSQLVLLAISKRIHGDYLRIHSRASQSDEDSDRPKMYPGDTFKVHPPPPSIHQHIYMREPPPSSLYEFWMMLPHRHVTQGGFLAYLLKTAIDQTQGYRYLVASAHRHPENVMLWMWDPRADLSKIKDNVFSAAIIFLCRFTRTWMHMPARWSDGSYAELPGLSMRVNRGDVALTLQLEPRYGVVYALILLKLRRSTDRAEWASILTALAENASHTMLRALNHKVFETRHRLLSNDLRTSNGSIFTIDVVCKVLDMMGDLHLDLNYRGLLACCICAENAVFHSWKVLRDEGHVRAVRSESQEKVVRQVLLEAAEFLKEAQFCQRLQQEFRRYVGADSSSLALDADSPEHTRSQAHGSRQQPGRAESNESRLEPLLAVPSPQLLHVYIRALGWWANFDGLLELVRWMVQHGDELAENRARDRNGHPMMRRALCALRAFLERSWYFRSPRASADEDFPTTVLAQLKRVETPAPPELVAEIRDLVQSRPVLGSWPTESEVVKYCAHERFEWTLKADLSLNPVEHRHPGPRRSKTYLRQSTDVSMDGSELNRLFWDEENPEIPVDPNRFFALKEIPRDDPFYYSFDPDFRRSSGGESTGVADAADGSDNSLSSLLDFDSRRVPEETDVADLADDSDTSLYSPFDTDPRRKSKEADVSDAIDQHVVSKGALRHRVVRRPIDTGIHSSSGQSSADVPATDGISKLSDVSKTADQATEPRRGFGYRFWKSFGITGAGSRPPENQAAGVSKGKAGPDKSQDPAEANRSHEADRAGQSEDSDKG